MFLPPSLSANQASSDAERPVQRPPFGTVPAAPSPERFRTVFDRSPLGQTISDARWVIRQANGAAAALLGFTTAEELVGWNLLDFSGTLVQAMPFRARL